MVRIAQLSHELVKKKEVIRNMHLAVWFFEAIYQLRVVMASSFLYSLI